MCGLFITNDSFPKELLERVANRRLAFRGPDYQSGIREYYGWYAYHSRLSIIGTSPIYSQPYVSKNGSVLLFNGEILNYQELAESFGLKNVESDTQVLSLLLEMGGFDLDRIEGFYSFVFIGANGELKQCARDRFGVKPLFFFRNGDRIAISSEASVLSDLYGKKISKSSIDEYSAFRAPIFSGSYFEGVETVQPGECLVSGKFFDSLDYVCEDYTPLEEILPKLERALGKSVASRQVSDVLVALLYSGGVDSNLIYSRLDESFPRFTGGDKDSYDMLHALNAEGDNLRVVNFTSEEFKKRFEDMIRVRKEPLSVPNEVILSLLADSWASEGGKVLLSGEAADELFAGYDRIFSWAANLNEFDLGGFIDLYSYTPKSKLSQKIFHDLDRFFLDLGNISAFEKVRQFFIKKHLPVLFRRLDFSLMFSGVEGREPLAAKEIFELALQCAPDDLLTAGLGKYPLRKILSKTAGDDFSFRPKEGFPIDVRHIFEGIRSQSRHDNYDYWMRYNLEAII